MPGHRDAQPSAASVTPAIVSPALSHVKRTIERPGKHGDHGFTVRTTRNPRPDSEPSGQYQVRPERRANTSVPGPFYAQDYWMAGRPFGALGSSDEHSGQGGRRHGGIAAVFAERLTREALFEAIRRRACCATTGQRILLDFSVDGAPMGGRVRKAPGEPLRIHFAVWGTATLLRCEVLRHRFGLDGSSVPILFVSPRPESLDAVFNVEDEAKGKCVYYARVVQEPLSWPGMAWTSPVWVDPP